MKNHNVTHFSLEKPKITSQILHLAKRYSAGETQFWLKSAYQSTVWVVVDSVRAKADDENEIVTVNIDFSSPPFSDGTSLTTPGNEEWEQLVRACLCYFRSGVGTYATSSAERMSRLKNAMIYCIDYFRRQGRLSVRHLEPSLLDDFVLNFLPYGPAYFLDWRERFLIALKKHRYLLIEGAIKPRLASILVEANISNAFEKDPMYCSIRDHIQDTVSVNNEHSAAHSDFSVQVSNIIPTTTLSAAGMNPYLAALQIMHEVGPFIAGTGIPYLTANPLKGINSQLLSQVPEGRTKTIPAELAVNFIAKSIEYIETYSNSLLTCYNYLKKKLCKPDTDHFTSHKEVFQNYLNRRRNDSSFVLPRSFESVTGGQNSLYHEIFTHLVSACAVVLFAFSARRESEIYDLRTDCRNYKDLLKVYIAKTSRAYDFIPKVQVVDRALDVLLSLSLHNRQVTKSTKVFEFNGITGTETVKWAHRAASRINAFATEIGCNLDGEGHQWRYSEHQFRRFFAMMYYWRSESKNIEALSYHLRHFSLEMTHRYIEEAIAGDAVTDVAKLKAKHLLKKSLGNKTPMGRELEKRQRAYKKFVLSKLNVLNIQQASKRIQREFLDELNTITDNSIEYMSMYPEMKPWGVCFGRAKGRNKRAKCVPAKERKELEVFRTRAESASCEDCLGCSNFYADEDNIPFLEIQIQEDKAVLDEMDKQRNPSPSLIAFIYRRMNKMLAIKKVIEQS